MLAQGVKPCIEGASEDVPHGRPAKRTGVKVTVWIDVRITITGGHTACPARGGLHVRHRGHVAGSRIEIQPKGEFFEEADLVTVQRHVLSGITTDGLRLQDLNKARAQLARELRVSIEIAPADERSRGAQRQAERNARILYRGTNVKDFNQAALSSIFAADHADRRG